MAAASPTSAASSSSPSASRPERVRQLLGVDSVLRVKRINLADGEPFAVVTVWCPAELGQHLSRADVEQHPFYELLDMHAPWGDPDDRCRRRVGGRGPAVARAGRRAAVEVPAGDDGRVGHPGAGQRAPLSGPSHRVRRRPARRGAVVTAQRAAPRGLERRKLELVAMWTEGRPDRLVTRRRGGGRRPTAGAWPAGSRCRSCGRPGAGRPG